MAQNNTESSLSADLEFLIFAVSNENFELINLMKDRLTTEKFSELMTANNYEVFRHAASMGHLVGIYFLLNQLTTGQLSEQVSKMMTANHYEVFDCLVKAGHFNLINLLIDKLTTEQLSGMMTANDYEVFRHAASKGHFKVINLLIEQLTTEQLSEMITANDYEVFRHAAIMGHLKEINLLIERLTPQQFSELMTANDYKFFRDAASKGHLEEINLLIERLTPQQFSRMMTANNYEVFDCLVKAGQLETVNRFIAQLKLNFFTRNLVYYGLMESPLQKLIDHLVADEYKVIQEVAKHKHLTVLFRLMDFLTPEQIKEMIAVNNYEIFFHVAINSEALERLMNFLTPEQIKEMIAVNNYEIFFHEAINSKALELLRGYLTWEAREKLISMATSDKDFESIKKVLGAPTDKNLRMYFEACVLSVRNGRSDIFKELINMLPHREIKNMICYNNFRVFYAAIEKENQEILGILIQLATVEQTGMMIERIVYNYDRDHPLAKTVEFALQKLTEIAPAAVVKKIISDKYNKFWTQEKKIIFGLIAKALVDDQFDINKIDEVPKLKEFLENESFHFLKLACKLNKLEMAEKILAIPNVLESAQQYQLSFSDGLSLKEFIDKLYPLNFSEPHKDKYIRNDIERNQMHVYLSCFSGNEIGLDNTCKSTESLKQFFGFSKNPESFNKSLENYIQCLEKDIAILRPNCKIALEKAERLKQLKKYQSSLKAIINLSDIQSLKTSYPEFPQAMQSLMSKDCNLASMQLSPEHPDGYLRTVHPVFSLRTIDKDSLISFLTNFNLPDELNIENFVSNLEKKVITFTDLQERLERAIQQLNRPVSPIILERFTPALREQLTTMNPKQYHLRESFIEVVLAQFNELPDKTYESLQTVLQEQAQSLCHQHVDFKSDQRTVEQTLGEDLNLIEDTRSLIEGMLGCDAPALFDNVKLTIFQKACSVKYNRIERLNIAVQFFLAEINIYCQQNQITTQNFGLLLQEDALRNDFLECIAQSHVENFGSDLMSFINKRFDAFGLSRALESGEIEQIQHLINVHFMTIEDSPHFDEFSILNLEKPGGFFSYSGEICVDYLDFLREAIPEHPLNFDSEMQEILNNSKTLPVTLLPNPKDIKADTIEEKKQLLEEGYPLGFLLAKLDEQQQVDFLKTLDQRLLTDISQSASEQKILRRVIQPQARSFLQRFDKPLPISSTDGFFNVSEGASDIQVVQNHLKRR